MKVAIYSVALNKHSSTELYGDLLVCNSEDIAQETENRGGDIRQWSWARDCESVSHLETAERQEMGKKSKPNWQLIN